MLYSLKTGRTTKQFSKNRNSFGIGFGSIFNPDFDGNAIIWYDGNIGLSTAQWNDQGVGAHNIIFVNNPSVIPNAINGNQAIRFDGINQSGVVATPAINQAYTLYSVLKPITFTASDVILDDGVTNSSKAISQVGASPSLFFRSNINQNLLNNRPVINAYEILTIAVNAAATRYRWNDDVGAVINPGAFNGSGVAIGERATGGLNSNVEFAYLLFRAGADSTAVQDMIIDYLKNRFAL